MDENFFVLSGNEIYKIDDELLELKPGNFGIVADD